MKHNHNKIILSCILLFSMFTARLGAQLNGVYTINSAVVTGGTNYQTFTDFANALNSVGVSGPVTANVSVGSGPYVEQVNFGPITGASATNTITVNGNSTTLTFAASLLASPWTLLLGGADFMTFNNLTVTGTGGTYAMTCHLWNQSNSNRFNNCTFNSPVSGTNARQVPVSLSGSNNSATTSGDCGNDNIFTGCTMSGGNRGVVFYGQSFFPYNTGNQVINCSVLDFYTYGIYNYYCQYTTLSGNTVERAIRNNSSTGYGIYLGYNGYPTLVEKNKIRRMFDGTPGSFNSCYAIYIATSAAQNSVNVIRNNVISDINCNGTIYGIYDFGNTYNNIYHNTVSLDDVNATGGTTYGIISYSSVQEVKNNLISIKRGGTGQKICLYYGSTGLISNNNAVYNNSPSSNDGVGYYNGTVYGSLAAWQGSGNGWDMASASANPLFSNPLVFNYAPTAAALNNIGTPLGILTDITGLARNLPAPDAGAYEFFNLPCTTTPGTNTVVAPSGIICPSALSMLSLANSYTVNGITFQWQSSTTSSVGPFTAVPGATLASYVTPTLGATTWYSALITCANGGTQVVAGSGQIQIATTQTNAVPYFEGFENSNSFTNLLPNCSWLRTNATNCKTSTVTTFSNRMPYNGNGFANFDYGGIGTTNTYHFYSNGIQLNTGVTYSASVFYISPGYSAWSNFELKYGPNQNQTGAISLASVSNPQNNSYSSLSNTFQVSSSGIYYMNVTTTDNYGYSYITFDDLAVIAPCNVAMNAANLNLNAPTVICAGQTANLIASGVNTYSWSTGPTTSNLNVSPVNSTIYYVTGTNTLSNCSAVLAAPITVNPVPGIQIFAPKTSVCEGGSLVLSAFGSATSFTWSNGPTTSLNNVTPATSTTYSVTGINSFGCLYTTSQLINVNTLPTINVTGNTNICTGEAGSLTGNGADSYTWTAPGLYLQANPVSPYPAISTVYTVTGTDVNGCVGETSVNMIVNACTGIATVSGSINGLQVYPNPTNGEFTVELSNGLAKNIEVIDLTGRTIVANTSSSDLVKINISNLANGVYYVKVKSDNAIEVLKVVKH